MDITPARQRYHHTQTAGPYPAPVPPGDQTGGGHRGERDHDSSLASPGYGPRPPARAEPLGDDPEPDQMKNKRLNNFLYILDDWKECVLNYFTRRVTMSVIEGINNSIKAAKQMGYGFGNLVNFKQRILISFA